MSGTLLIGATLFSTSTNRAGAMADDLQEREQALRRFIGAHERLVRAALSRVEFDHHAREDLSADVFALAFRRFDELAELQPAQQRKWLVKTASHLGANHGRRQAAYRRALERWGREPVDAQLLEPETALLEDAEADEEASRSAALHDALAALTETQRQVLVLDAFGHDGPSIARLLNISPGAARKRLMLARMALRESYAQRADSAPGSEVPR